MATKKKSPKKAASSRAKATAKPKAKSKPKTAKRAAAPRGKPGAMRLRSIAPTYTVDDIERSLVFYRDVLGFTVKERWERDGKLAGLELVSGDVSFMFSQDDWQKGRDRQKGIGFRIYADTRQDLDLLAAALKARGATLDSEPKTEEWGRHFSLTDPDGFRITIVNERVKR